MLATFLESALIIFTYATSWYIISLIVKRNDIADIAWGLGYILLCLFYFFTKEHSIRTLILYGLVTIWGLRLAIHIYIRNRGKEEDFRYLAWRKEWGKWFYIRSYLQVYLFQGLFLLMIISPITITATQAQGPLIFLDYLGIFVWTIGFYFQSVGDYQLASFKKDPVNKGKIIKSGLWKYSRHPNYFGEVTMWWGLFLISVNSPYGIYGVLGPLTISFLILFVSGVPMMEEKYKGNSEFEAYKKETSKFIPFPVKKVVG